jgi:sortase A
MKKRKKSSGKNRLFNLLIAVIIVVGVALIVYPGFSDWWNNLHQSRAVAAYVEKVADLSKEEYDSMWNEAVEYNKTLLNNNDRFTPTDEEDAAYRSILDVTGTGIMGYIDIPSIDVELPVYHGTDDTVLQIAVGHIEGSSFPVGGEGTHCVVSGHTGLPSAKLFTDISKLKNGDTFKLQVLDRTLTYQVDQIDVVLPNQLDDLAIDPSQDYCTLVTCTPYGVNTHRLLVRGHRIPTAADDARITADALQLDKAYMAPALIVIMTLLAAVCLIVRARRQR